MSRLRTDEDYKRACQVAKSVIDEWDPYSLIEHGAPSNEFEELAATVVGQISRIRSIEDAVNAISRVFSDAFEPELFRREHCQEVGTRLYSALRDEGFVQ